MTKEDLALDLGVQPRYLEFVSTTVKGKPAVFAIFRHDEKYYVDVFVYGGTTSLEDVAVLSSSYGPPILMEVIDDNSYPDLPHGPH